MLGTLRFTPGSLVLVRYSTYPIWPATVQRNLSPGYNRFVDVHPNRAGDDVVAYWVVFSGDKEGGWVPADHIVPYHPDLVYLAHVPRKDGWHTDQTTALRIARRNYNARFPNPNQRPIVSERDRKRLFRLLDMYTSANDDAGDTAMRIQDDDDDEDNDEDDDYYYNTDEHSNDNNNNNNNEEHNDNDGGTALSVKRRGRGRPRKHAPAVVKGEPALPSRVVKGEPTFLEELTYRPPTDARYIKGEAGTRKRQKTIQRTRITRRSKRSTTRFSTQQEIADLRECLRRKDEQVKMLTRETRRMRASRTAHLRQLLHDRDAEIERLHQEAKKLRTIREVAPVSRIPTFEQWHRATSPASFRRIAARMQNKYSVFCNGVRNYTNALEQLQEARSNLSDAYNSVREHTQMTENELIDAEKALTSFTGILQDVRFGLASEDTVVISD